MADVIIIAGAPGSGKTTVCQQLKERTEWPHFEFGYLRQPHLNDTWTNASAIEEQMAFENLLAIIRNYHRHGYRNVLVTDLKDARVQEIPHVLADLDYLIVSLVLTDDATLTTRVLDPTRDSGFRWVSATLAWNRALRERPLLPREHRIDNTHQLPQETADAALALLAAVTNRT